MNWTVAQGVVHEVVELVRLGGHELSERQHAVSSDADPEQPRMLVQASDGEPGRVLDARAVVSSWRAVAVDGLARRRI